MPIRDGYLGKLRFALSSGAAFGHAETIAPRIG